LILQSNATVEIVNSGRNQEGQKEGSKKPIDNESSKRELEDVERHVLAKEWIKDAKRL
jgi:hypothetical protein